MFFLEACSGAYVSDFGCKSVKKAAPMVVAAAGKRTLAALVDDI